MTTLRSLIILFFLAVTALPVQAGWIETDIQGGVTYYGDGMAKTVSGPEAQEPDMILEFNNGTVTLVDNGSRTWTSFRFEQFCDYLKKMFASYPPGAMAMMKQQNQAQPKPSVSISKVGPGEAVAGFATTKYEVVDNGELNRTVWIAEDARLKKYQGTHIAKTIDAVKKMGTCPDLGMSGLRVDTTPAYVDLLKGGWLMREELVNEDDMEGSSPEVANLEEQNLPASTFAVPAGFRKVPMDQFQGSGM